VTGRGIAPSGGIKLSDGAVPAPSPRLSVVDENRELGKGNPGADRGDSTAGPSSKFWGENPSSLISDMEVGEGKEEFSSRKRKSQETRECTIVLAPIPIPQKADGRDKSKKKKK